MQFLILTVAGWVNRHQQDVIEYLQEENRILRQHAGAKRLRFTDAQRRGLAIESQEAQSQEPLGNGSDRDAGHSSPLVSEAGCPQVRWEQGSQDGTPA